MSEPPFLMVGPGRSEKKTDHMGDRSHRSTKMLGDMSLQPEIERIRYRAHFVSTLASQMFWKK